MNKDDSISAKDSEISRCSTSAVSTMSHGTSQQQVRRTGAIARPQRALYLQIAIQGFISAGTFGTLLILIVPFPILVAFTIFLVSFLHLTYVLFLLFCQNYEQIIQGNGIGQYIPSSLYSLLTEMTLHEMMQDNSFIEENQYLMLYLIPGISEEQLEAYVDSFSPRRRYQLRRHGLGHILGEGFMRVLMGESRFRHDLLQNQQRSSNELLPPPPIPRNLSPVIETDIDSINLESCASAGNGERSGAMEEGGDQQPRTILIPEDTREQRDHETNVLSYALNDMTNNFLRMSVGMVSSGIGRLTDSIAQYTINAGLMVTAVSTGVGLFGLWHNVSFSGGRITSTTGRINIPASSQSFLSMAAVGGIGTGAMILARQGIRWYFRGENQNKENDKSTKGDSRD